jgi:xanthosine utilization system XapX-like protein
MLNQLVGVGKRIFNNLFYLFKKVNRLLLTFILICISIIVLGIMIYQQRDILFNYRWQFHPIPIILSFIIFSLALFWASIVWGWIINSLGTKLSYQKHLRYYIVSNLAKRIPGTLWYVASRTQLYQSDGLSLKITTVASGMEMVLITLAGILVVLIFSTLNVVQSQISPIILIIIFIFGIILINPKVVQWILSRGNIEISKFDHRFIIKGILFYVISWLLGGIVLFEIGNVIYPIPIGSLTFFINSFTLVGVITTLLFFSPTNFGITEIGLSLLLSNVVPSSIAVIIAIAARIIMIVYEILWSSIFSWVKLPEKTY